MSESWKYVRHSSKGKPCWGEWGTSSNSQLRCWFAMKTWASRRYPERHVYGRNPRAEGSAGGLGNLILLNQRSAAIRSSSQSSPVSGSSELPYFLLLISFIFHLSLLATMEVIVVLLVLRMRGTCVAGFAELPQGWAGESLACLSR